MSNEQKIVYILSNKNGIMTTAKYIFLALEHRKTTFHVLKYIQNLTDEVVSQVIDSKTGTYTINDVSNDRLKMTLSRT